MRTRQRRRFCTRILLPLAALASVGGCTSRREPRPSVLLIVMDDLSFRIGLYGYEARTPQMSRLAQRGRRFDRAYCQYPLCSPSRTSLLTGWRPERTRVWGNLRAPRAWIQSAVPLQEHFRANGYFTARVGKVYHSRFENEFRWDVVKDTYDSAEAAGDEEQQTQAGWGASSRRDEDEPDGRAAREAVRLLEEKRDVPFFIAVGFLKAHGPGIAPEK
jgi:arylsulfatase A-like enzyme